MSTKLLRGVHEKERTNPYPALTIGEGKMSFQTQITLAQNQANL